MSVKQLSLASSDLSSLRALIERETVRFPSLGKPVILPVIRGRGFRVRGSMNAPLAKFSRGVRYSMIYATQPSSFWPLDN